MINGIIIKTIGGKPPMLPAVMKLITSSIAPKINTLCLVNGYSNQVLCVCVHTVT